MDATLPSRRRFNGSFGASTPGAKSVGSLGSLPASPGVSSAFLPPAPRFPQHPGEHQRQQKRDMQEASRGSTYPAQQPRSRKSSQAETMPAVSHFSIAAVLKPGTPAGAAAANQQQAGGAAAGSTQAHPSDFDKLQLAQQRQQQLHQRQQPNQVSIDVDATHRVQEQPGGEASTSGPQRSGSAPCVQLCDVQAGLACMGLHDVGVASVPMEAASPLRGSGSSRGSSMRGSDGSGMLASMAAAALSTQPHDSSGSSGQAATLARGSTRRSSSQEQGARQPTADTHYARGYALRKRGDFAGAVQEYTAALAQDPSHFKSLFNRAFSLDKVGGQPVWYCKWLGSVAPDFPLPPALCTAGAGNRGASVPLSCCLQLLGTSAPHLRLHSPPSCNSHGCCLFSWATSQLRWSTTRPPLRWTPAPRMPTTTAASYATGWASTPPRWPAFRLR